MTECKSCKMKSRQELKSFLDLFNVISLTAWVELKGNYQKIGDQKQLCGEKYASILKDLVSYMRFYIRPKNRKNEYFELFELILESARTKERANLD